VNDAGPSGNGGRPAPVSAEIISRPPWHRRHPVVLDTTVLIADVLKRSGTTFTALTYLAERELISIVAPRHVEDEVFRRLPKGALETNRDPARALETLMSVYLPLIRFVDLTTDLLDEPGVIRVAKRDGSDAPLAHLATLLSPCLVLSCDNDLAASGFGSGENWLADVLLLGDLTELDAMVWGGGMTAYLAVALPSYGLWKLLSLLARSKVGLGVAGAIAIGGAIWFRPQLRGAVDSAVTRITPLIEEAAAVAGPVLEKRAVINAAYRSRLVLPSGAQTMESAAARYLVSRGHPVASELLHREMNDQGHDVSLTRLRAFLRAHPAFVAERGKGYQLGEPSRRATSPDLPTVTVPSRSV